MKRGVFYTKKGLYTYAWYSSRRILKRNLYLNQKKPIFESKEAYLIWKVAYFIWKKANVDMPYIYENV